MTDALIFAALVLADVAAMLAYVCWPTTGEG